MIYLDHAATTPLSDIVKKTITDHLEHFGNPSSIHQLGRLSKSNVEKARKNIAEELNANTADVFFTSGATEANNTILNGCVQTHGVNHIISTKLEHPCVCNTLDFLQNKHQIKVTFLNHDQKGRIDIEQLKTLLETSEEKVLVSLMHGNNELGNINPIKEIGQLCDEFGAFFHSDAAQTFTKIKIDVQENNLHFLSASGHKFNAPKGIGIMYIKGGYQIDPYLLGGGQERTMRSGTENYLGIVALDAAFQEAVDTRSTTQEHLASLKQHMINRLNDMKIDYVINGDTKSSLNHILSINFMPNAKTDLLEVLMDMKGICVSAGSACSSGSLKRSKVITALGLPEEQKTIRFSFGKSNSTEEVDHVVESIKAILSGQL